MFLAVFQGLFQVMFLFVCFFGGQGRWSGMVLFKHLKLKGIAGRFLVIS